MGYPMARHLLEAGHDVALWSHTTEKAKELAAKGKGLFCETPRQVAENSDVIFIIVGDTAMSENVVFGADNDQLSASGVQVESFAVTSSDGSGTVREDQFLTPIRKGEFNSLFYRTAARMLGAIADINEIDSNVFKSFADTNANGIFDLGIDTLHTGAFVLGDIPIDGLVMAKRFDQTRTNVTPEAKFTASGFFDHDNLI